MSQGVVTPEVGAARTEIAEPARIPGAFSWPRGFWSLVITQFQGAFNENGLKNLVVFLILGMAMQKADRDRLVLVVGTLFSVPFILFSMTGGFLADRYSKRTVTIGTKIFEMAVMVLAIAGLAWQNLHLEMAAVFLASTQAALFGPSKYGLLPELLPEPRLSWGNGVLELGTFLAVIAGGVSGAFLADVFHGPSGMVGLVFLILSLVGLDLQSGNHEGSRRRSHQEISSQPNRRSLGTGTPDPQGSSAMARGSWQHLFLVSGRAADGQHCFLWQRRAAHQFDAHGHSSGRGCDWHRSGQLDRRLSFRRQGRIWIDSARLAGHDGVRRAAVRAKLSFAHVLVLLAALGFSAGFFAVPVNALIQHRPDEKDKGGVIAAANLLSFVGIGARRRNLLRLSALLAFHSAGDFPFRLR